MPPSRESYRLPEVDGLNVVPISQSQVQNVSKCFVVTLVGVTMASVPQPVVLEVPGPVQCLKRVW